MCVRVCVCVCVCVTEAVTSMSPSEELVSSRGKIRGRDMRSKTQTDSCPLWLFFSLPKLQSGVCG